MSLNLSRIRYLISPVLNTIISYHDLPADSKTHEAVVDDLDTVITYRPSDRWNTTAKAGHGGAFQTITQASTIYGGSASTPMPELTLDITGKVYCSGRSVDDGYS